MADVQRLNTEMQNSEPVNTTKHRKQKLRWPNKDTNTNSAKPSIYRSILIRARNKHFEFRTIVGKQENLISGQALYVKSANNTEPIHYKIVDPYYALFKVMIVPRCNLLSWTGDPIPFHCDSQLLCNSWLSVRLWKAQSSLVVSATGTWVRTCTDFRLSSTDRTRTLG